MSFKYSKIALPIILLITLSLACALTGGGETSLELSGEDSIATSVAATLAAVEASKPTDNPPPAANPTMTADAPPPPQPNFDYAGVSFYFSELLAENITAGITPGNYDENAPWWSTPEHREFQFNNWVLSDAFHTPLIRIYPVGEFRAINDNVGTSLDELQTVLENQPLDGTGLGVSDIFNAGQFFQSQVKYLDFQNGSGARWLSQYGQALFPVGWPYLFYTFQGFTNDGAYYISIIMPVNHPSMPNPDSVTLDDAFFENYETYIDGVRNQLEAESDASFMPSLVLLDQIVESLLVGNP